MDFFSILLPGALITFLLMGEVGPLVLGDRYSKLAGAEAWAVFLFASYLFGHPVFRSAPGWMRSTTGFGRKKRVNLLFLLLKVDGSTEECFVGEKSRRLDIVGIN
jgi:hypothetical protein